MFPLQKFAKSNFLALVFLCILSTVFLQFGCKKSNNQKWIDVDPAFAKYIEAYTTGIVSKTSSIRVQLSADAATTHTVGQPVADNIFKLSPAVKGKTVWLDARTIEFKPEKNLEVDKLYTVDFNVAKVTKVPSKFEKLGFNFQTVKPSFTVNVEGLRTENVKNKMQLNGEVFTADVEDAKEIEKVLNTTIGSKSYPIKWQHSSGKKHVFVVNNIERVASKEVPLTISWNGKPLAIKKEGEQIVQVPAVGDFKVLSVTPVNDVQQYASIKFSETIALGQDLTGLVTISNEEDVSYTINGSEVKLFSGKALEGNYTVNINTGIKDNAGKTLSDGFTANVVFENKKPNVKILGKGNILPSSGKLVLPFDAINLNAVDVSIIKIFENNVPQFLQQNDLNGENELRRVAKPIVQKTIRLDDDKTLDLRTKQRFSLDIDKFLKTEPGAVYRVTLGFRPTYSLYSKMASDTSVSNEENANEEMYYEGEEGNYYSYGQDDDEAFWSAYDNYYPRGYSWERRDDPTSPSYFNKDRWASRNILASNIGLTAKRGNDNSINVAASSIISTEPLSSIDLLVLDFQNQVIAKGTTDGDGFANIILKQKPYLLIAKKGVERGYLKLDDGSALALSRFDIVGDEIQKGIKGFIFGERGVWRPGDSLFLNCIVEDKTANLPKELPIQFDLITPQGQLYKSTIQTNATDGFNVFKTVTDAAAPTGNWLVRAKLGGAIFEKRIKIETVMPNRLKININFGNDAVLGANSTNTGTLNAMWLFGSPASNLKAKIDATISTNKTVFAKYAEYEFDNPTSNYSTQLKTIFDGALDANGNATVNPNFQIDGSAPGMLTANLTTKVFEPGGSFSIDNFSVPYSPFNSYVGIKMPKGQEPFDYLLAGKSHTVSIVNVDSKSNLLQTSKEVEVQFYKIQWRWWWDADGSNLSNFTQDNYNKLISTTTVALANGKANWSFKTGANEWGRYLLLVKDKTSGHTTGKAFYVDEPGWQSRSGGEDQTAASMLSFKADKDKYAVGEEIKLTIPSAAGGRMLISLETGSKVIKSFWEQTVQGQTIIKFKAEAGMAPNIYATVSLLQPHSQTINDLPIRMYGSIPLFIEDKNTILTPQINMPAEVRPESNVTVSVSEKNGKGMTYCIAVVDDGLLDLTRYKTPNPHQSFYAREALGVKSFDMYDLVLGAWSGDLERILTIGGDEDAGPVKGKKANRFKPVVKYFGPFTLGSGQTQSQTFVMPNYFGSVRTMVVAAKNGSYGFAEKTVAVKKPLMVAATMPRMLAPAEIIKLPVTVFAMDNSIKQVNVKLEPNNFFEIIGSNTQQANFEKVGEQLVYFDVKVKSVIGVAKMKVLATSGKEMDNEIIELDVRNPNPIITNVQEITLAPGQKWDFTVKPIGIASADSAVLQVSSLPALNLQKRLSYLISYPHGCVEQTTSAAFPQLVLYQLADLSDFEKANVDKNVKAGIAKLQNFARPDGGFGYWPDATESDDWGTTYAGHFLIEAQSNGYSVGDAILNQWKNYQKAKANAWVPSTTNFYGGDLAQAYRLYTLALAKAGELGAMNRLKEFKFISPEAKWRLAAAYKLIGQDNTALDLIAGLPTTFTPRTNAGFTYGSDLRDQAMVLETLTLLGKKSSAAIVLNEVANKISQDAWYSTQTTAYSLLAIAKYCGKNASGNKIIANTNINGTNNIISTNNYLKSLPISFKQNSSAGSITNNGANILYVKVITQGQPLIDDTIQQTASGNLLGVSVNYFTQDGSALDISQIKQGKDFIAKVTVSNKAGRQVSQLALTQIFPTGWEILNPRMADAESAFKSSPSTYQDVRDDRVNTYFNLRQNDTYTFYVQLNAAYLGKYYLAPVDCRNMYENTISGSTKGKWVEVVN
jgi:alpha-2-macroglobulin